MKCLMNDMISNCIGHEKEATLGRGEEKATWVREIASIGLMEKAATQ